MNLLLHVDVILNEVHYKRAVESLNAMKCSLPDFPLMNCESAKTGRLQLLPLPPLLLLPRRTAHSLTWGSSSYRAFPQDLHVFRT